MSQSAGHEKSFKRGEAAPIRALRKSAAALTPAQGDSGASDENSVTTDERGQGLLQDHHLLVRVAHFHRERMPGRAVYVKGSGAFGTLSVTRALTELTTAPLFQKKGTERCMLARFPTIAGEKGFADTVRDPYGFSLKIYA